MSVESVCSTFVKDTKLFSCIELPAITAIFIQSPTQDLLRKVSTNFEKWKMLVLKILFSRDYLFLLELQSSIIRETGTNRILLLLKVGKNKKTKRGL